MKRINNLILALAGLFAVACADTFEERYDLAVNTCLLYTSDAADE